MVIQKEIWTPSVKAQEAFDGSRHARFTFLEGAVRSSKSFTANDIALRDITRLPACDILLSGYSISSIARNVVAEWQNMLDPYGKDLFKSCRDNKEDYLTINYPGLTDKKFYIRGAGKDCDYKQIQGATFGYWLADEFTRHHETFVNMAFSRLSMPYSRGVATMNPDSPFHFAKKKFLDNEKLFVKKADGTYEFVKYTFYLTDNPSLTQGYIDNLKNIYTGVFYKRYILSLWVLAEGAIYDFFTKETCTRSRLLLANPQKRVVGIDYGTGNPSAFIIFGIDMTRKPFIWAEREYYYDSKKHNKQKTDEEYSADLKKFIGTDEVDKIIVDPSAASLKVQLVKDGFSGITDAKNDVLDGIRTQARMLKSGEYAVCEDCKQTIEDYDGYVWDEKAQLKGEDKPIKQNDHTKDTERYVIYTLFGERTIDYEKYTKE
jgi:PBSX family phage terminase large subunit